MILDDIQKVLEQEPLLNVFGIGLFGPEPRLAAEQRAAELAKNRQALLNEADTVEWVVGWLRQNVPLIKTINRKRTSYGLKHVAEKHYPGGYVANGTFIAAALVAGYPYVVDGSGPNVMFGMSEKAIKMLGG